MRRTAPLPCTSGDNREIQAAWEEARSQGLDFFPLAPDLPEAVREALLGEAAADTPVPSGPSPLPGLYIATSGSEGWPKAIRLTPANLAAMAHAANRRLGFARGDLWLACLPLCHIGGMAILYRAALAGGRVLVHPGFDPGRILEDLQRHPVTHISLVPAMLPPLLEARPPARLRCALVGGGPLDPSLAARAADRGWPLWVSYGLTEAASLVTCTPWASGSPLGRVGLPLEGMEAVVREGRLWLRGGQISPTVMRDAEGWFRTGDLARIDRAGRVHILGRADDLLVSGGHNVHPLEVEAVLKDFPGIGAVALSARPDPRWGQRLVAVVEGPLDTEAFLAWTRERLPPHQRPREVLTIPALPRGRLHKLDRRALGAWVEGRRCLIRPRSTPE